ncbi:MAG: hypothetical protein R3B57_07285 [Phycisphaerales bacterium]
MNGHGASSPTQGGAPNVGWELGARGAAAQRPHDTWWRLLRRATVVGAGVSLMLHLVLWAIVSLWTVKYEHADAGGAKGSVVDFAVMSDVELSALQSADLEMDAPSVPDVGGAEAAPVELIAALTGAESITPDLARVQLSLGGGTASSSSFDLSAPGSGASGSGSGASFFGLEAQGRRFAYIVDRSGSMAYDAGGVTRLRLTQDELSRSIDALLESAEFFIVMYSDDPDIIGKRRAWTDATTRKKLWARSEIERVIADGGTRPMGAFETVFRLRPQPDAIYFMTDGRFYESVPQEIKEMNARAHIPIHCIMFGEFSDAADRDDVERMMRTIATDSGGSFARVEGKRP